MGNFQFGIDPAFTGPGAEEITELLAMQVQEPLIRFSPPAWHHKYGPSNSLRVWC